MDTSRDDLVCKYRPKPEALKKWEEEDIFGKRPIIRVSEKELDDDLEDLKRQLYEGESFK